MGSYNGDGGLAAVSSKAQLPSMVAALGCCFDSGPVISTAFKPPSGANTKPTLAPALESEWAPANFFYSHFHNGIRAELDVLQEHVRALDPAAHDAGFRLAELKEGYAFLEQLYKYHSVVEDEVVYPALDTKVRNVTSAYTVEHEEEGVLFEHLALLLSTALAQSGDPRASTLRQLVCKVEEIHTTLRKHLAKEEGQLLPLLLVHFSHAEQAELVAQFLYCIPLATVERVLAWLKPRVPQAEQEQLLRHVRAVVPDTLLLQLLVKWLQPVTATHTPLWCTMPTPGAMNARQLEHPLLQTQSDGATALGVTAGTPAVGTAAMADSPAVSSSGMQLHSARPSRMSDTIKDTGSVEELQHATINAINAATQPSASGDGGGIARPGGHCVLAGRPPLQGVAHFHRSIGSAMESFVKEARALGQGGNEVTAAQLSSMVERLRFLRSVCMFHSISEEEVVLPELYRLRQASTEAEVKAGPDAAAAMAAVVAVAKPTAAATTAVADATLPNTALVAWDTCSGEHAGEMALFEDLGRRLADVRALVRRGRKEVTELLAQIVDVAERACSEMVGHMAREEADILASLERSLPAEAQCAIVWRMLRAMPLRLLERVMPWVFAKLCDEDAVELLNTIRIGAPEVDTSLVELLTRQAQGQWHLHGLQNHLGNTKLKRLRGRWCHQQGGHSVAASRLPGKHPATQRMHPRSKQTTPVLSECWDLLFLSPPDDDPRMFSNSTCEPHGHRERCGSAELHSSIGGGSAGDHAAKRWKPSSSNAAAAAALEEGKQQALLQLDHAHSFGGSSGLHDANPAHQPAPAEQRSAHPVSGAGQGFNPIDHIFQFHGALRQELRKLELDAAGVEHAVQISLASAAVLQSALSSAAAATAGVAGQPCADAFAAPAARPEVAAALAADTSAATVLGAALQQLDGRFQFLRGIYQAHSRAEDEIVFPALESKEALHNVSHAYTLDHQQEEQLLEELGLVIQRLRACSRGNELLELSLQVCRMCAAMRAALETHIRAEEAELWPLFVEHFTSDEQQYLVGVIIGRTGATVLQALLPFVSESVTPEEKEAMMESLRGATKNTMFDQWLGAIQVQGSGGLSSGRCGSGGATPPPPREASGLMAPSIVAAGEEAPTPAPGFGGDMEPRELTEVVRYLSGAPASAGGPPVPEVPGTTAESTAFRPGWEDIFRMNQKQLEAAIRRVSNDPSLEPTRKAYLIQNILVSKYIVAQQKRMGPQACSTPACTPATPRHALAVPSIPAPLAGAASLAGPTTRDGAPPHGESRTPAAPAVSAGATGSGAGTGSDEAAAAATGPSERTYFDRARNVLGCPHYRRRARLVAPCCNQVHTCRLCHDEVSATHRMDRYAVSEMVCMECATLQPVAAKCSACNATLSAYYCNICHLFDDEPGRDIYHCPFCNVCRRGKGLGVDFFHCMHCNACMSLSLFSSHKCRERCMESNCPACNEYLFDSSQPIKELPCGHFMHSSCFATHTRYHYTCPLCSRSIGDMSVYFQMLDSLLASERLPAEYAGRTQQVLCHDCNKMGFARYHFVYHACPHCHSYNTRVL